MKHILTGTALCSAVLVSGAKETDTTLGGNLDAPNVPSAFSVLSAAFVRREPGLIGEHSQSKDQASPQPQLHDSPAPSLMEFAAAHVTVSTNVTAAASPPTESQPAAPEMECQPGITECHKGRKSETEMIVLIIGVSIFACLAATSALMFFCKKESNSDKYGGDEEARTSSQVPENEYIVHDGLPDAQVEGRSKGQYKAERALRKPAPKEEADGSSAAQEHEAGLAKVCSCGQPYVLKSKFCRQCGKKRSVGEEEEAQGSIGGYGI